MTALLPPVGLSDDDREYLERWPTECHEEVTRKRQGEQWAEPCERLAVAAKVGDEGEAYPVCARHASGDQMVALADLLLVGDMHARACAPTAALAAQPTTTEAS